MQQIAELIAQLDVPTPTVLLEVKILRVTLADGLNSAFEYSAGDADVAGAYSDGNQFAVPPAIPFPGGSTATRILGEGLGVAGRIPGSLTFQGLRPLRASFASAFISFVLLPESMYHLVRRNLRRYVS